MNSDDKSSVLIVMAICVAIFGLGTTVSNCVVQQDKLEQQLQMACIQKGGSWVKVNETSYKEGCRLNGS